MNIFQAFILGVLQGLTEFIPVSSTAHLLVVEHFMNIPADDAAFAFSVLVQLGTILSLVIFYWKDLLDIAKDMMNNLSGISNFQSLPFNAKLGWLILLATIPALIAGVILKKYVEKLFGLPLMEASIRFLAAALLLFFAEYLGNKKRKLSTINWIDALLIGTMQVIAVFPGASRSGTTISGGMFRGFDRPSAARFAFLMSLPIMIAAGAYESLDLLKLNNVSAFMPIIIAGFFSAAIVGWLAIKWLIKFLNNHTLYVFAAYCFIMGIICVSLQFVQ